MPPNSVLYLPAHKNGPITSRDGAWFRDHDGAVATTKRYDEIREAEIDWSDRIGGDIISSVTYVDSGVTRTLTSNTTKRTTTSCAGLGEFEVTATLSSGRKEQEVVRFYDAASGAGRSSDYR